MAVVLAVGIAASDRLGWPPSLSYALLIVSTSLAVLSRRSKKALSDALLVVALALAGMSWHAATVEASRDAQIDATDPLTPIPLTARIVDPPVRHSRSWGFVADLRMPSWLRGGRETVRARVTVPQVIRGIPIPEPRAGELWLVNGSIEPFPRPRNPGDMDTGAMLSVAGIHAVVRGRSAVRVDPAPSGGHATWLGRVQTTLYAWIDRLHVGERSAFLKGVILGYRSELSEDLKAAFLATGTVHILAVSGGNVALIALVALIVAGLMRLRRRSVFAMAVIAVVWYAWVTGSSPSVVRASVMAVVFLAAGLTGRRPDVFQSLGVAAVILLVLDPRNLFDIGFQLSFISVLAIVIGSPMLEPLLNRLPEEFRDHDAVRSVVQLLAVSAAAQVGTLPLTMSVFGQVSLVSVIANLAVVPLSGVALVLGIIELILVPFAQGAALVYAGVNDVIMALLLGLVRVGASLPLAAVEAVRPDGWSMAAAYAFLGVLASGTMPGFRRTLLFVGCACAVVAVWRPVLVEGRPLAEIMTIDVGQGDAHLIRTFGGGAVLIDTGPSEFAAERAILPTLQRQGVRRLDEIVITHGHRDHAGGLGWLLDRLPVRTLTLSDSLAIDADRWRQAKERGVSVRVARRGDRLTVDPSVRFYILHPGSMASGRSANDRSVVVKLTAGTTSLLLTGDLEEDGEDEVAHRYGDFIRADVLKVAHHGSRTGTTAAWLDHVRPAQAIVSVGRGNTFGHPDPERMSLFHERRIAVIVTMEEGAAWFTTDGRRWSMRAWRRSGH